jgi:hypothetical protein
MVIALAGRRIDPSDADTPRFPLANAALVRERLRPVLGDPDARALVASAACGADLIALELAGTLRLRRVVVLPFDVERFRTLSVIDRPGDWGPVFDRVVDEVTARGDLIVLRAAPSDEASFAAANDRILIEASRLAAERAPATCPVLALAVWEGSARGPGDTTAAFLASARARGLATADVSTR